MAIEIERVDAATAPEPVLRELAEFWNVFEAEDMPGDPPTPHEALILQWRNPAPWNKVDHWFLREEGGIVALAFTERDPMQNLQNGAGWIYVHPDHRGRGFARRLAPSMFDLLEDDGRIRFATWVKKDHPIERLLARLGLKSVYHDKWSRLKIEDLDMDLMKAWVARAPERAADYELRYQPIPVSDSIIEQFCEMHSIMNTAPREDLEHEDEVLTPHEWRDREEGLIKAQSQLHHLIAIHKPTGVFAGFTQVKTQDLQPDIAWQWNTGVHPDHRSKGLGRWLKAEMIQRIVNDYPDLTRIDTYNAGSNEPMLNINIEMGFRLLQLSTVWQGELATVREKFGA